MKCNCLIFTEMRYKPCFNGYNHGYNQWIHHDTVESIEVIKLYNTNIKRSQSCLYNVLE